MRVVGVVENDIFWAKKCCAIGDRQYIGGGEMGWLEVFFGSKSCETDPTGRTKEERSQVTCGGQRSWGQSEQRG